MGETDFRKELEQLINRHSVENNSNTPDFVLAGYLTDCLRAFNFAVNYRDRWYGYSGEDVKECPAPPEREKKP